jgi:hypothetical protein
MEQVTNNQLYPTEMVDLPSKGMFYPENSPLRSGQIELKYMTAKEEDILTSTNLIQKGIVLDKLMDSLIVTKGVKSSDLFIGDLNAVMIASRILGYGKDYTVAVACPKCNEQLEEEVDLSSLETVNEPTETSASEIKVMLPASKAEVTLRLLTRGDELSVDKENKALKKASDRDNETTSRLRAIITSVNGDATKSTIWTFVENMLVKDSRYLREQYKNLIPDVSFDIPINCTSCGHTGTVRLPIGPDFFWPDARV